MGDGKWATRSGRQEVGDAKEGDGKWAMRKMAMRSGQREVGDAKDGDAKWAMRSGRRDVIDGKWLTGSG